MERALHECLPVAGPATVGIATKAVTVPAVTVPAVTGDQLDPRARNTAAASRTVVRMR